MSSTAGRGQMSFEDVIRFFEYWPNWAIIAAMVAGVLVATFVFEAALRFAVRSILRTFDGRRGTRLYTRFRWPLRLVGLALFLTILLPVVPVDEVMRELVGYAVRMIAIAAVGAVLIAVVNVFADILRARHRIDVTDNLDARRRLTQVQVLRRISIAVITLVTIGAALMTIPAVQRIGVSLLASAGIAGVVLGIAARPVFSNIIAGIQLALTQPIRVDDVVIVEGEWGWIEEITTTYVVVRIWDWRRLIVPLTYFIEKPFQNWTRSSASIIGVVTWAVDYTVPIGEMRAKTEELVKGSPLWDGDVCNLQVIDSTERTIEVRALMSARNSPDAWQLRCHVREQMVCWLQEAYPDALPRMRATVGAGSGSGVGGPVPVEPVPRGAGGGESGRGPAPD